MADHDKHQDAETEDDEALEDEPEEDLDDEAADDGDLEDDPDFDDDPDDWVDDGVGGDSAERAASVAKALGVGDDEAEDEPEDESDQDAPVNRAQRRRQRALRRRGGQRRAQQAGDDSESSEESPAKDRNARRRAALLLRRKAAAAKDDDDDDEMLPEKLLPSEMVDDALARGGAATVTWIKRHLSTAQWVVVVVVLGAGAYLYYDHHTKTSAAEAAHGLATATAAEDAIVIPAEEDDRTEDQKKFDVRDIYGTDKEREDVVLKSYREVIAEHSDSGASILAKLGEGGALLDRRQWDEAITAFDDVLSSKLAPADPDVQARAHEGRGFALEGKDDLDGALKAFEKLGAVPGGGFDILAQYHQARVMLGKEQKDRAKELLVEARTKLEKASTDVMKRPKLTPLGLTNTSPYQWLEQAVDEELRAIDPSAIPAPKPGGMPGGGQLTPEQIQQLLQQQGAKPGMPGR